MDRNDTGSPVLRHHRQLPVVPRPRFPAAILPPPPSLVAAMFAPCRRTDMTPQLAPAAPFRLAPSVDCSTPAVPSATLLPPPLGFCHPAFWGAFLIGRALFGGQQGVNGVEDGCLSGSMRCDVIGEDSALRHQSSTWRKSPCVSSEPRQLLCDHVLSASKCPDVCPRPPLMSTEAASSRSGLEDMAKMVNRLDPADVNGLIL